MAAYNILDARNNLSRIITMVESGAEATIMRRGKPVAKIVPMTGGASERGTSAALAAWFADHPVSQNGRAPEAIEAGIREMREAGD